MRRHRFTEQDAEAREGSPFPRHQLRDWLSRDTRYLWREPLGGVALAPGLREGRGGEVSKTELESQEESSWPRAAAR